MPPERCMAPCSYTDILVRKKEYDFFFQIIYNIVLNQFTQIGSQLFEYNLLQNVPFNCSERFAHK